MQRFKSPAQAQEFLFAHGFIYGHFRPRRYLMSSRSYRQTRAWALQSLAVGDVRPIRCVIAFRRLIAASQPLTKVTVTMPSPSPAAASLEHRHRRD
jgi:hypothetical protein